MNSLYVRFQKRLKEIKRERNNPEVNLRVSVVPGGCYGFQTVFELIEGKPFPTDLVFEKDGTNIFVDDISYPYIKGSTLDFTTELIKQAFVVTGNPNSGGSCGCHVSFSVKD
eukprot:TRINITY_DN604_c0_g1_i1.p1 TRINITY_DN604_c0_g1~~TRINITY_DN604_c0_g1_i1.p1  ORF type:complete len:112 (-),score=21.95 TRINITY_DN604_c0_g1_i1:60-395(-)